jgi:hypothetical protein
MDQPLVLQQRDERGVVTLTLNRPHSLNALSEAMLAALGEAFVALAEDESARAVVLGASGRAFCAGHDLKEMRAEPSLEYYERLFAQCSTVMLAIQRLPVPVIARVYGLATVPGFQRAPCHANGEEHSWRQAVHRHAVAAPFGGDTARQVGDAGFGGVVRRLGDRTDDGADAAAESATVRSLDGRDGEIAVPRLVFTEPITTLAGAST